MTGSYAYLRVCFFIPSLGDGGAQRQCVALLNALQHRAGLDLHLILLARGPYEEDLRTERLTIHRIDVDDFGGPGALVFVVRVLRRIKPDVLISWLHPADIWSYVATRVLRRIPWIMTERGSRYPDRRVYRLRTRLGLRGPAMIIANSPAGADVWTSQGARSRVRIVPNMVLDADRPIAVRPDRATAADCVVVGRLEPQKNVVGVASAFACLAVHHPMATLRIVGTGGEADEVSRIARDADLAGRIVLEGFRDDVPDIMARARLLLSFSRFEGMPNVLMEAVRAGLPSVVSDIPEHRHLLGDDYPYYVPLDAPAAVAADVIDRAWNDVPSPAIYAHARDVLVSSEPDEVVAGYVDAFITVAGAPRAGDTWAAGIRRLLART